MYKGIDVSTHNGVIDWQQVKAAGIQFAMLRACYGWDNNDQIDKQFYRNVKGAKEAGMPIGAYHYSYATSAEDAVKEARFFLRVLGDTCLEYPVAFDFEEKSQLSLPTAQQMDIIEAFLGEIEQAGFYGVLYCSPAYLRPLLQAYPERMAKYDRWVAHIDVPQPAVSGGIWQYSWKGRVNGIRTDVDLNYAYKDYLSIIKEAGLNGWESTLPDTGGLQRQLEAVMAERDELQSTINKAILVLGGKVS